MAVVYTQAQVDTLLAAKATTTSVTTLQSQVTGLTAASVGAAPYALASGASAIRFIGAGTVLPATATTGDVFLLTT